MGSPGLCMKLSTLSGNPLELGRWNYDVKVDAHHSWRFLTGALMRLVIRGAWFVGASVPRYLAARTAREVLL